MVNNEHKNSILDVLQESQEVMTSKAIANSLSKKGNNISERTIRLYLQKLDEEGFTENYGKAGRKITQLGEDEINSSSLMSRVGYLSSKIDRLTYQMDFDLTSRSGSVIVNVALIEKSLFIDHLPNIEKVFEQGYAMGKLVTILLEGESAGGLEIPPGFIGFCTVCSVTLNGVMLKHGIPVRSLFSGLVELKNGKMLKFAELINYNGTSLDPLALFIRAGMTDYLGAIKNGNGRIGAGFREIPAESRELVLQLAKNLDFIGLGAFAEIGISGKNVLNIPVSKGCCGAVVIGGLNPVAVIEESGKRIEAYALSGLMDFQRLYPFNEISKRVKL